MKENAVIAARVISNGREFRTVTHRDAPKAIGKPYDTVAIAHPDLIPVAGTPQALEQIALAGNLDIGPPKFTMIGIFHFAALAHTSQVAGSFYVYHARFWHTIA
jgi:hypothetical protein